MKINPRHQELLLRLDIKQARSVGELAQDLGISEATLRRDLVSLSDAGKVVRTHGGVLLKSSTLQEAGFIEKATTAVEQKRLIGEKAAEEVPSGSTVFVDSGTTCLEAARILIDRGDCRLITNSIPVLVKACTENVSVTAVGGEVRGISRALVGGTALTWLNDLRADIALIGASGLDSKAGAFTTEPLEAGVKVAAMEAAAESWLLADSGKWEQAAALKYASWSAFDRWFVDSASAIKPKKTSAFPALTII